jgi:DNA modification methylase
MRNKDKFSRKRDPHNGLDTQIIYCGDCLEQLERLPEACIDLIYIDPPFNSNRNYEVFWGETKENRRFEDRHASTAAYIDFMRPRCVQLARVLKPTGSFYYHCDWHASHYVKVMLDQILGENNFRNEIVWCRSDAHNDARHQFATLSDSIFFYTGGDDHTFNVQRTKFPEQTLRDWYLYLEFADGTVRRMTKEERETQQIPPGARRFNTDNLRSPNPRPNLTYDYKGYKPHKNGWAVSREKMEQLDAQGLLLFPKDKTGRIMRKKYLDESDGPVLGNVWDDISQLRGADAERKGYPTQKPLALLDRIIQASSNRGDIVLDAFCGCGTAVVSAQNLGRRWIGIDISPTACRVIAKRLRDDCKLIEGKDFVVRDLPRSEDELRKIPPFEFENWAVIALGGIKNKTQVGDMGIDGRVYPAHSMPTKREDQLGFMDVWYPIQVKQKDKVGRPDIDAFEAAMMRENRMKGFFVSFAFTRDALTEIDAFFRREGRVIIPLTVREILDEEIASKLA